MRQKLRSIYSPDICKKSYDKPRQHTKKQRYHFADKGPSSQSYSFSNSGSCMDVSESWTIKKAECRRIDVFELWCWRRFLRAPWIARRSKQSMLKEIGLTTGKIIALTRQIFVGKVMSLLFNTLSGLVITFLSRSKRLLISWLQSPSAVILEPKKIKSVIVSPSICHGVMAYRWRASL